MAFGIERLVSVMQDDNLFDDLKSNLDVYIMPLGEKVLESANSLANFLRLNGFSTDICLENKNMSQMFKKAERRNASFAVIIGEDELNNDCIILKNLHTKEQIQIKNEDLLKKLDESFGEDEHHHHEEN